MPSLRSGTSSGGAGPAVEKSRDEHCHLLNRFIGEIKPLIIDRLWQDSEPPSSAPSDWDIRRDLSVLKSWLQEGYDPEELVGAIKLYEGHPCTTAAWQKCGNRAELTRLIAKFRKAQDLPVAIGDLIPIGDD